MLTKNTQMNRDQIEMIALEQLVPANHLVRKIEAAIDFSFINSLVQDMYSSERGRPSIDPVVLIKMAFIQYTFGIRSMRQTIAEIETNMAYRWFLGFVFMISYLTFQRLVKTTSETLRILIYLNRFSIVF
jgi:transposase